MEKQSVLVEFVRDKNNRPIGVIIALSKEEFGWSLCAKADRQFGTVIDKQRAYDIAFIRASNHVPVERMPKSFKKPYQKMLERSARYFK